MNDAAVLRAEHQDIAAQAHLFERTVHQLENVEHRAILAGGKGGQLALLARPATC